MQLFNCIIFLVINKLKYIWTIQKSKFSLLFFRNVNKLEKFKTTFVLFWYKLQKTLTPNRQLFIWYVLITIIGAILLYLPFTHNDPNVNFNFLDAIFTSASAFSDTGLTVAPTAETFNIWGQIIIFVLFIIGGIGWFTMKMLFLSYLLKRGKKGIYKMQSELNEEKGFSNQGSAMDIIKFATFSIMITILVFTIVLAPFFYFTEASAPIEIPYYSDAMGTFQDPQGDVGKSIWTALFTSASAINNAGFDITSSYSIAPYFDNVFLQVVILFLFIVGGIGFPILYDTKEYIKNRSSGKKFRFSLLTKLSVLIYFTVALTGWALVVLFEFFIFADQGITAITSSPGSANVSLSPLSTGQQLWAITFNTFSTRNAGFSTVSINAFSDQSQLIFASMMFIGSGPSSTAGGVRTTTMGIIIFSIWSYIRNREGTSALKHSISNKSVYEAFVVILTAAILCFLSIIVVSSSLSTAGLRADGEVYTILDVIFEVLSSFGTTGLSNGLTSQMNEISLIMILLMMFVGQLGVATLLKQFRTISNQFSNINYTKGNIVTG